MNSKIAIVGAGASGVFCALQILSKNSKADITIFEKGSILGSILPTGGGRCNLAHNEYDNKELAKNYPRGEKFLYSIFSKFALYETLDFFKSIGISTYIQDDGRIFPTSNSSKDVRAKLLKKLKVKILKQDVQKKLDGFDFVVIATGSKGGYELAKAYGHTITPLRSALCGYITKERYPKGVVINVENEPLLFTHQGISGPYIFKLSSILAYNDYPFKLNLPFLNADELFYSAKLNPKKSFKNMLCEFIPKSLVEALNVCDIQCANVKKSQLQTLETLNFTVLSPDKKGETVRAGGVDLNEIKNTTESKINPRLYFIGEILDVDGFCGGFNLQFAWSSAAVAAADIISQLS